MVGINAIFILGPYNVTFPKYAENILKLSEQARGIFLSFFGVGLLIGSLISNKLLHITDRKKIILISLLLTGISFFIFPFFESIILAFIALTVAGSCLGIFGALVPSTIQTLSSDKFRGRFMSIFILLHVGLQGLRGIASGIISDITSAKIAILLSGFVVTIINTYFLFSYKKNRDC